MLTGVYKILNISTGDFYIGSAAKNFNQRFRQHRQKLLTNIHPNTHLQNAWNKYGENSFKFIVLFNCPAEYCLKLEQWSINNFNPRYNICKVAGSCLGISRTEEHKQAISIANKGRKRTEEHNKAVSIANYNNRYTRGANISMAKTGRGMSEEGKIANRDKRRLHKNVTKLSTEDVIEIKRLLQYNFKNSIIATLFPISPQRVGDIRKNRAYTDIKITTDEMSV